MGSTHSILGMSIYPMMPFPARSSWLSYSAHSASLREKGTLLPDSQRLCSTADCQMRSYSASFRLLTLSL